MAPSGKKRKPRSSTRKPRKTHYKKKLESSKTSTGKRFPARFRGCSQLTQETESVSAETNGACSDGVDAPTATAATTTTTTSGCSTPRGRRFRIPEISTCPPAPKKQRVVQNCSVRRSPIAFFAPPDIEVFFLFALGHVPA